MALSKAAALQILLVAYVPLATIAYWGLPKSFTRFYHAHPWELSIANFTLPMLALMYTRPRSRTRLAVPSIIAVGISCYHATSPYLMPNRTSASALDGPHMLLFLTAIDALLLRRLYLDNTGKERSEVTDRKKGIIDEATWSVDRHNRPDVPTWSALAWAAHVFFSYRAIGTSREANNIPSFSARGIPSRAKFLLDRGCAIVVAFVIVDFLNHQPPPSFEAFAAHKSKFLLSRPDITVETIFVRVISTAIFWFALRVTIGLIYNLASFIGVTTFLTAPTDWPPYFGSPTKGYTLRKFWAVFWHSGLRNPLLGTSNFITYDLLRLRRGTLTARYANIWLAFGVSGMIHKLCDDTSGIPRGENTAYKFFLMQALGITLEDFVEWVYQSIRLGRWPTDQDEKIQGKGGVQRAEEWQKAVGFLWVASWLIFTTPAWSYQNMRHDGGQLFPFSLRDLVQGKSA